MACDGHRTAAAGPGLVLAGGSVMDADRKPSDAVEPGPEGSLEQPHADPPAAAPIAPAPRRAAPVGPASPAVTFPQIARLELDDLVEQLVDRATDVLNTQGRLHGLLAATRAIASDLSLPVLLRRITEAGCELVGARYGALGVLGPDNQLTDFITVGVDEQTVERVGHFPHGVGILGLLIATPGRCGWRSSAATPTSVGFPPATPRWAASSGCRSGSATRSSATST